MKELNHNGSNNMTNIIKKNTNKNIVNNKISSKKEKNPKILEEFFKYIVNFPIGTVIKNHQNKELLFYKESINNENNILYSLYFYDKDSGKKYSINDMEIFLNDLENLENAIKNNDENIIVNSIKVLEYYLLDLISNKNNYSNKKRNKYKNNVNLKKNKQIYNEIKEKIKILKEVVITDYKQIEFNNVGKNNKNKSENYTANQNINNKKLTSNKNSFSNLIIKELEQAEKELDIDKQTLEELLIDVINQIYEHKILFFNYLNEENYEKLHKIAHKLKGAALSLRLKTIGEILKNIDNLSKTLMNVLITIEKNEQKKLLEDNIKRLYYITDKIIEELKLLEKIEKREFK